MAVAHFCQVWARFSSTFSPEGAREYTFPAPAVGEVYLEYRWMSMQARTNVSTEPGPRRSTLMDRREAALMGEMPRSSPLPGAAKASMCGK
jgi:hypothetical protein